MYGHDKLALREVYFKAWKKFQNNEPLTKLEHILATTIMMHPEYHDFFEDEANLSKDLSDPTTGANHFFHLGLHCAIMEQIDCNSPLGIKDIYQQLILAEKNSHIVEHKMMGCLAEFLAASANSPQPLDEQYYLNRLKKLL